MAAIVARDLSFAYRETAVIGGVDLTIPEGRLVALLGRNGSGKSTLLRLLAGLLAPVGGSVEVLGRPLSGLSPRHRARLIGFLPQHHRPVFPFTVADVVLTGRAGHAALSPSRRDRDAVETALDRTGLGTLALRPYTELSGGERQLVLVARVLAQEPQVLLLDEPLAHLDLAHQAGLITLLTRLVAEGLTVVAALHDPNVAAFHCQQTLFLAHGRMLEESPSPPWSAETLRAVYGGEPWIVDAEPGPVVLPGPRR